MSVSESGRPSLDRVPDSQSGGVHLQDARLAAILGWVLHRYGVYPPYEAILEAQYSQIIPEGAIVLDVGAHAGRHTRVFRTLVGVAGRVIAVEPLPDLFAQLSQEFGADSQVELHRLALSSQEGSTEFIHAVGTPEESGLRQRRYNLPEAARPTVIRVDTKRLDTLAADLSRCDFIKLDIEGAELDCLAGARATLTRHRPVLSIEYGEPSYAPYGHSRASLFHWAEDNGYVLLDLFGFAITTEVAWMAICDRGYWDYFAVPAERLQTVQRQLCRPFWPLAGLSPLPRLAPDLLRRCFVRARR